MNIQVERLAPDRLARRIWDFYVIKESYEEKITIRLNSFRNETRDTTRHKFKRIGESYAFRMHNGHHYFGRRLPAADVPMSEDVIEEIKARILASIEIIGPMDPKS